MKNIGIYILLVIIGGIIGASAFYFLMPNQTPIVTEQEVKVTIQGIKYVKSDYPVLEIELLNDAPEKNLDGIVGIYQGDKQWTSEVTWYYTGYGEAAILVDTINENQSFRITYNEKNPKATYLDRTIEWYEVQGSLTIGFMETSELTVTQITFDATNDNMTVAITNSGTSDVTISMIKVNGDTITLSTDVTGSLTYAAGNSHNIVVDYTIVAGNKYSINLFAHDGTLIGSFTDTA